MGATVGRPRTGGIYRDRGSYRASVTYGYDIAGRQLRLQASAKDLEQAQAKLDELKRMAEETAVWSVASWLDHWLTEIAPGKLHPKTLKSYQAMCGRHIVPVLGPVRLDALEPAHVRMLHRFCEDRVSSRTVQIIHSVLSTALADAVRDGVIDMNVCRRVDRPKSRSRQRPVLTADQAARFLRMAKADLDPLLPFWALALYTGARKNELVGLEWNRVDLEKGAVAFTWQLQSLPWAHGKNCGCRAGVRPAACPQRTPSAAPGFEYRQLQQSLCFTRPKTVTSSRLVVLPGPLVELLREIPQDSNRFGLVFSWHGEPLKVKWLGVQFRRALRRAGLPEIEFHSLRHTCASLLLESGVSPEVIAMMLGHSSVAATRGYLHPSAGFLADASQGLNRLLGGDQLLSYPHELG